MNKIIGDMTIAEINQFLVEKKLKGKQTALGRLAQLQVQLQELSSEALKLCEDYELDFILDLNVDGVDNIHISRAPGWNSSEY